MFPSFFSLSSAVAFAFVVPRSFTSSFSSSSSFIFVELHLFIHHVRINLAERKTEEEEQKTGEEDDDNNQEEDARDVKGYEAVWVKEKVKEKEKEDYDNHHDEQQDSEVYKKG
ncbi:hypothetical protein CRENBAI_010689 [Crenichthys baileyi]|uniref:Uncharacterized protein n=1 Tax=Crenichthys baileyi TaxID=28760 RepID=A0AAV9RYH9_9TELE